MQWITLFQPIEVELEVSNIYFILQVQFVMALKGNVKRKKIVSYFEDELKVCHAVEDSELFLWSTIFSWVWF